MSQDQLTLDRTDPRTAMVEFEQLLASNSGEDPFETAVRLLAAKLFDELRNARPRRKFRDYGNPGQTLKAIETLYADARKSWPWLNGNSDQLGVSSSVLTRCLRPLVGWDLLGSDLAVLDATLERLVSRESKGQLGQYFTPREIARLCVEVLNPSAEDLIIDPASGSGGFLFEAAQYSLDQYGKAPKAMGIDLSARSVKVGSLLSESHPHLNIRITKGNSLDQREHRASSPTEWEAFRAGAFRTNRGSRPESSAWSELQCSLLLTNPPFAGEIDEIEVLRDYASVTMTSARPRASREHLFLERAVRMLKPGGRLAIVLPQAILANSSSATLRQWLMSQCRLLGVIGLHPFAFLPFTSVKTSLLFAQRRMPGEKIVDKEPVFFAVSTRPGKDSSGRATGPSDYSALSRAFRTFLSAEGTKWAKKTKEATSSASAEVVGGAEVRAAGRLDAEHFDSDSRKILKRISSTASSDALRSFLDPRIERFRRSAQERILYVDISSVDAKTGISIPQEMAASDAPSRASYVLQAGDVLVSTVRPERNVVALIEGGSEVPRVASSGFCVLRPKGVAPEVIFAYCKTDMFRTLLSRHSAASMYPTVTDKDVLSVPFCMPPVDAQRQVVQLVRDGMRRIADGNAQIKESISVVSSLLSEQSPAHRVSEKRPKKKYHSARRPQQKG